MEALCQCHSGYLSLQSTLDILDFLLASLLVTEIEVPGAVLEGTESVVETVRALSSLWVEEGMGSAVLEQDNGK